MKPILKKICRERGQEQNPSRWQENGWAAEKCPNCNRALHRSLDGTMFECDWCYKLFERKGWKLEELTVDK